MKTTITTVLALLTAVTLTACSTGGGGRALDLPDAQRSDQDISQLMAVNDRLIVPGVRAGPVFLGMTEGQLYNKMGSPSESYVMDNGGSVNYQYSNLIAFVRTSTHKVFMITVTGPGYSTAEGVSTGTAELAMKAKLGPPFFERMAVNCSAGHFCDANSQTERLFCYDNGLTVNANGGYVTRFTLWTGHCER